MKYVERHLFGTRTTTVKDNKIIVTGHGLASPAYEETFLTGDLSPNWSKFKMANGMMLRPFILITLILCIAFICSMNVTDLFPNIVTGSVLVLLIISCLCTLFIILFKEPCIVFKHRSGLPAFLLGRGKAGALGMEAFATSIVEHIIKDQNNLLTGTATAAPLP